MDLDRYQKVEVRSRQEWRSWLEGNHTQVESIWLVTHKKSAGAWHVPWSDAVDEALCFGWIDSRAETLDETRRMVLFAPRRKGSTWSRINKDKIERLTAQGRMHSAGLAKIERAKADGSWSLLDEVEAMVVPPDLIAALGARPLAAANFEAFPRSAKKAILHWIVQAKRPETRERRIRETAELAARNIRADQPRG